MADKGASARRLAFAAALAALLLLPLQLPEPVAAQEPDLPPAIAAQVEGCAAVAVGRRRVTAAGCPGVGIVMIRLGPGEPDLPCHARAGRARTRPRRCLTPAAQAAGLPVVGGPTAPAPRPERPRRTERAPSAPSAPAPDPARASGCHPAYVPAADGSCVPDVGDRRLTCAQIGDGKFELVNKENDPYGLDDRSRVGNGVTCDGIGGGG